MPHPSTDPDWINPLFTICVWSEDECTRNQPGHEGWRQAWQRLQLTFDGTAPPTCDVAFDGGDAHWYMWRVGRAKGIIRLSAPDGDELRMTVDAHAKWVTRRTERREEVVETAIGLTPAATILVAVEKHLAACPLGFHEERVMTVKGTTDADIIAWLRAGDELRAHIKGLLEIQKTLEEIDSRG